ncbi:MAG: hypothetical protein ACKVPJ_01870 [Chitinophagales bacterium]
MNYFPKLQLLFLLLYLIFLLQNVPAATFHAIDSAAWKEAVDGLDYTETPIEEAETLPVQELPEYQVSRTLQVILFIVVIGLLVYILLRIFGKDIFAPNKKVKTDASATITDLDEKPMESDLERFLREALQRKDFRLAIRIYYLMILQALHEKEIISWRKNKTNKDYVIETSDRMFSQQFAGNTLLFEYVWYGEKMLEEVQFNKLHPSFLNLIDVINKSQG